MRAIPAIPSRCFYLGSISGIRAIILGAAILNLATSCSTTPQILRESKDFVSVAGVALEAIMAAPSLKRADKPTSAGSSRRKTSSTKRAVLENQSSGPIFTLGHTTTARPEARQPNRQPPADSPPSAPAEPKLPPQTAQQSVVPSTGETTLPPQKTSKD